MTRRSGVTAEEGAAPSVEHSSPSVAHGGSPRPRTAASARKASNGDTGAAPSARENVAAAAKNAIAEADKAVRICNDAVVTAMDKLARKARYQDVLIPLYAASYLIEASNGRIEFLGQRGIKPHGNVKNIFSPIVLAFTKNAHPLLRDRMCKYAQVIWLAGHENVAPDEFPAWLKSHPTEKACAEYRRIMHQRQKAKHDDEQISRVLIDPGKQPEKAPLLPATPITWGYPSCDTAIEGSAQRDRRTVRAEPQDRRQMAQTGLRQ
ncbi:MAG: hypothetical protein K2Z80_37175 [Xanthobacteraceae bacterium]|nr:hypothetical protein [Xanthobacteraceae bacterium]